MSFGMVFCRIVLFCTDGVKHDGILSPFLFNVFIYNLLAKLAKLNVVYCIGHYLYGCIAYANGMLLLVPSLNAQRLMLECCFLFSDENDVIFNPKNVIAFVFMSLHHQSFDFHLAYKLSFHGQTLYYPCKSELQINLMTFQMLALQIFSTFYVSK